MVKVKYFKILIDNFYNSKLSVDDRNNDINLDFSIPI